jgi:hypothetical protein
MSAFAVRVNSDKQTLILAGEPLPPVPHAAARAIASRSETAPQLQRVTMLLVQREYGAGTLAADSGAASATKFLAGIDTGIDQGVTESERMLLPSAAAAADAPSGPADLLPYPSFRRALSARAAEYARTQDLSAGDTRSQLIDTYA